MGTEFQIELLKKKKEYREYLIHSHVGVFIARKRKEIWDYHPIDPCEEIPAEMKRFLEWYLQ